MHRWTVCWMAVIMRTHLLLLPTLHVVVETDALFQLGSGAPVPVLQVRGRDPGGTMLDEELAGKINFIVMSREPELASLVSRLRVLPCVRCTRRPLVSAGNGKPVDVPLLGRRLPAAQKSQQLFDWI